MQRMMSKPVYGKSIRSNSPLSFEQIEAVAPSIFATEKHHSRSARYTYVPTFEILKGLQKEGFEPFMVTQAKPKIEDKNGFAKHMVRLRHASTITGEEANEIIILNSHDGTTGAQLLAGVFRFVCQNGCVAGDVIEDIRVRHTGNIVDDVIEGSYRILEGFERVNESMADMKSIRLSEGEQMAFARSALALKYDNIYEAPIRPEDLLRVKRLADTGKDLWTTMQKSQEALIRGGLQGRTANNKRTTTRPVNGISENVKLNKAIWSLAEAMRNLKGGSLEMVA